jgi:hypothetical protein
VPYWRKPDVRLTTDILPCARHILKAIFARRSILSNVFTIAYGCNVGCQSGLSREHVSSEIRGDYYKNIHAIAAIESTTISYTVCEPGYKITLLFTIFWRIQNVSYEKALEYLSRNDRFKATVYAMNTLLIHKGIYTQNEFQQLFVEWASKQGKISTQEISHEAGISV